MRTGGIAARVHRVSVRAKPASGPTAMTLKMWQVDAFAAKPLEGNQAAIIPLESWLDTGLMQKIANENNLAETAYFVKTAPGKYDLRWFTPATEVDLCGHATLASAWTVLNVLEPEADSVDFETRSGTLSVRRGPDAMLTMSLPAEIMKPAGDETLAQAIADALDAPRPHEVLTGRNLMAVWNAPGDIRALKGPGNIAAVLPRELGLIATAPGDDGYDFLSRYFAPHHGVPEDPVTGSAHCGLTPYWAKRLDKTTLKARQVSPRGGDLLCTHDGARTIISGPCALYMTAEIHV